MPLDIVRYKTLTRRAFIVGGFKIVALGTILSRLVYLQIIQNERLKKQSDQNKTRIIFIMPPRGIIKDRNGAFLAFNEEYKRIVFTKSKKDKDTQTILKLAEVLKLDAQITQDLLERYKTSQYDEFILYKHLSYDDLMLIKFHLPDLEGVFVGSSVTRRYKHPYAYSNFIGYIAPPTLNELKELNRPNHPDLKVGKTGIESTYNSTLFGTPGIKEIEINSKGEKIQDLNFQKAIKGSDLTVSLDSRIQEFAYDLTEGMPTAICLIYLPTEEIITWVSSPAANINTLSLQITNNLWTNYNQDPYKPLLNRVTNALYPPGSTFKPVVALAALESGIDPEARFYCPGYFQLGNRKFHCWKEEGHGHMNMLDAIQHSCNVYFYNLGTQLKISDIKDVASRLGLGEEIKTVPFNQNIGLVPSSAWKLKALKDQWRVGDNVITSIGQGYLQTNCLQLAVMMARLAKNKFFEPVLLQNVSEPSRHIGKLFKQEHIDMIKEGMFRVVNRPGGTALGARSNIEGFDICGKTGTGQTISKNFRKEDVKTIDFFMRSHGLFTGFAPYSDPKFAIAVISEHGGFGSTSAAPLARQILTKAYEVYSINS